MASGMPHQDMISREIADILKVTPGKPDEHQARVTSFTDDLVHILNECATYKYNWAHELDSAAAFFMGDTVGLCGVSTYFKVMAVARRADAFNELDFIAKRGGVPELGSVASFTTEQWGKKDKSDVLHAFVTALACAKVGLHISNKGFQLASKNSDAEAAQFMVKGAYAYSEQVRQLSHFVTHLKLVANDKHAIKNFDRELGLYWTKDLAYAAAIEAVSPSYLQMGVMTRLACKKTKSFETSLLNLGHGQAGTDSSDNVL